MHKALGYWMAEAGNQRRKQYGETSVQALTSVEQWVHAEQAAYRTMGTPYGDNDDGLLRWLRERWPAQSAA